MYCMKKKIKVVGNCKGTIGLNRSRTAEAFFLFCILIYNNAFSLHGTITNLLLTLSAIATAPFHVTVYLFIVNLSEQQTIFPLCFGSFKRGKKTLCYTIPQIMNDNSEYLKASAYGLILTDLRFTNHDSCSPCRNKMQELQWISVKIWKKSTKEVLVSLIISHKSKHYKNCHLLFSLHVDMANF